MYENKRINVTQLESYRGIIPDCFMGRLAAGEIFAIETYDTWKEDNPPVGIVVMGTMKSWAEILWYGLADDYNSEDYAVDLIRMRENDALSSHKASGIIARLPAGENAESMLAVFDLAGYDAGLVESKTLEFTLGDVDVSRLIAIKDPAATIFLSDADNSLRKLLSQEMALDVRNTPIEIPVIWERYAPELSVVHMSDGKPDGTILVRKAADSYEVSLAYAKSPAVFVLMMSVLIDHALKNYPATSRITAAILDDDLIKGVKLIAPSAKREQLVRAVKVFPVH